MPQNETVDYKLLYHKMVNATEDAMDILIAAQRECEELYLKTAADEEEEAEEATA